MSFQKVNHFRNARVITRKDNLKKSIDRYGKLGGKYAEFFDIMPATFILPEYKLFLFFVLFLFSDYPIFLEAFQLGNKINKSLNLWIMKPCGLSRGRGIEMISDLNDISFFFLSLFIFVTQNP